MPARTASRALAVAALIASAALAACGGGSSDKGAASSGRDAGKDAKAIALLRKQAFGPNAKARSGVLDGTIDVDVTGVPRFKDTVSISQSGPFDLPAGSDVPDFALAVSLGLRDKPYGGDLVLADRKAFIAVGSTGYTLPDATSARIVKPAAAASNGLTKTLAVFYIAPQRWEKDARIVGDESIAGVDTVHVTTGVRSARFFLDASRLTDLLTDLRVTEISGLPTAIGAGARAALVRSVKSATGNVWIGKADHVLRKAHLEMKLATSKSDRRRLGGIKSLKLVADLNVTEVGKRQKVRAPSQLGSYQDLQGTLDVLGEAIRRDARGK
ncbi:MAG: hypothetical protein QOJ63_2850 [Solirubrobacteraceae bacterium]|jgi:hypothetical protein|nr:hypothetical protein [Solirubrobacteraceae bacterium]